MTAAGNCHTTSIMSMRKPRKPTLTPGSGNAFADLGLPDAAAESIKARGPSPRRWPRTVLAFRSPTSRA
jgi:hypothetical protein